MIQPGVMHRDLCRRACRAPPCRCFRASDTGKHARRLLRRRQHLPPRKAWHPRGDIRSARLDGQRQSRAPSPPRRSRAIGIKNCASTISNGLSACSFCASGRTARAIRPGSSARHSGAGRGNADSGLHAQSCAVAGSARCCALLRNLSRGGGAMASGLITTISTCRAWPAPRPDARRTGQRLAALVGEQRADREDAQQLQLAHQHLRHRQPRRVFDDHLLGARAGRQQGHPRIIAINHSAKSKPPSRGGGPAHRG